MNDDHLLELAPGAPLRGTAYRVITKLGSGGMGAVYEGEHVRLKRRVCIKIIHPGMRGRDEFLARMEREAQTLARLDHPGIVKVFDLGVSDDGIPYFVMERLEGKDLRRLLDKRRFFALPDALAIMKDVLEALAHAHTEGIVHRDIKPENVFLALAGADAITKVLDFGIAHVTDDPRGLTGQRFLGTCQYAAPEQLQGSKPTERTDIYAAGCMLFELIAGRRPHPGPRANDFIRQHLQDAAPRLSTFVPVPPALDDLVASALEKDPSRRPISALWFAAQVHQLAQIADDVVLATANTTAEMLLTAATAGADSSPKVPVGPVANDTLRDAALPLGVGATTPDKAPALAKKGDTVRLVFETAPLDMRRAATREAGAVPRLTTEELSAVEHDELEGRPRAKSGPAAAPGLASPSHPAAASAAPSSERARSGAASTGGALSFDAEIARARQRERSTRRRYALIIASPVLAAMVIAGAILIVGLRREASGGGGLAAAPSSAAPSAAVQTSPSGTNVPSPLDSVASAPPSPPSPSPSPSPSPAAESPSGGVSASAPSSEGRHAGVSARPKITAPVVDPGRRPDTAPLPASGTSAPPSSRPAIAPSPTPASPPPTQPSVTPGPSATPRTDLMRTM